ncbi:hypothetical protein BRX36_16010 [Sphingomonas sp. S-NIH.Pt1_0416]|nr:hypothetical protein BRX36_16010 [Sphingomonas sp. S-NIH.Pt1_0416]
MSALKVLLGLCIARRFQAAFDGVLELVCKGEFRPGHLMKVESDHDWGRASSCVTAVLTRFTGAAWIGRATESFETCIGKSLYLVCLIFKKLNLGQARLLSAVVLFYLVQAKA